VKNGNAKWAIIALTIISMTGIIGGVFIAWLGGTVGAVVAVTTAAVGGIVAIVLRMLDSGSPPPKE